MADGQTDQDVFAQRRFHALQCAKELKVRSLAFQALGCAEELSGGRRGQDHDAGNYEVRPGSRYDGA